MCKKICFMLGAGLGMLAGMYIVAKNNETKKMVLDGEQKVVEAFKDAKKQVSSSKNKANSSKKEN